MDKATTKMSELPMPGHTLARQLSASYRDPKTGEPTQDDPSSFSGEQRLIRITALARDLPLTGYALPDSPKVRFFTIPHSPKPKLVRQLSAAYRDPRTGKWTQDDPESFTGDERLALIAALVRDLPDSGYAARYAVSTPG